MSLDYPFYFGTGAISSRLRGRRVSESRSRAIYSATYRGRARHPRHIETAVYRESVSRRIASFAHNFIEDFSSRSYTLVPKDDIREKEMLSLIHI